MEKIIKGYKQQTWKLYAKLFKMSEDAGAIQFYTRSDAVVANMCESKCPSLTLNRYSYLLVYSREI